MKYQRSAGILLHPTSLPGKFGIGDLGIDAFTFIDFLKASGQSLWQVFPLGPTGFGDSPYQCFSAFAGNPLLISLELLYKDGLLNDSDISNLPQFDPHKIDYGEIIKIKYKLFEKAFANYVEDGKQLQNECGSFCDDNNYWLDDYATFMALKDFHGGKAWNEWGKEFKFRDAEKLKTWKDKNNLKIDYHKFLQYIFYKQWTSLKQYANEKGIKIVGDLPIFIAYDSADLWSNKSLFSVDKNGNLETVAGVPPDYFSPTGQLWGNPLYKWDLMEKNNFAWWKKRLSKMYEFVDIVRIDHFRGLDAFWEIPGDAPTAEKGRWVKAPGEKLFKEIRKELGDVPILAEDLGVITKSVEELRDSFGFPGMKILQFAFGKTGDKNFLPHNHIKNCVVYSGTHDNDTTRGFFETEKNNNSGIYQWAQKYLNYYGDDMVHEIIRTAYASVANIVIIPMQDILNLGTDARMNFPGRPGGNWTWRFSWDQITDSLTAHFNEMTKLYERPPKKIKKEEIEVADK